MLHKVRSAGERAPVICVQECEICADLAYRNGIFRKLVKMKKKRAGWYSLCQFKCLLDSLALSQQFPFNYDFTIYFKALCFILTNLPHYLLQGRGSAEAYIFFCHYHSAT